LEVVVINIPTLFKIMDRVDGAIELADSGITICELLLKENFSISRVKLLDIKIKFFLAGIYYSMCLKNDEKKDVYKNYL
jgi:hypothetical protein